MVLTQFCVGPINMFKGKEDKVKEDKVFSLGLRCKMANGKLLESLLQAYFKDSFCVGLAVTCWKILICYYLIDLISTPGF